MADYLKSEIGDVKKKGFGIIPKLVTQDKRLSIEAKAIYAYMASFAGAGDTAFPGVEKMIDDLSISENRFYKHRKMLLDLGYITITKTRKEGRRDNNIYTLNQIISEKQHLQNEGVEKLHLQNEDIENEDIEFQCIENECTNNNSLSKTTVLNNNSIKKQHTKKEIEEVMCVLDKKITFEESKKILKVSNGDIEVIKEKYEVAKATGYKTLMGFMIDAIRGDWQMPKSQEGTANVKKTSFHNFDGRTSNYTPEELEKMVLNKHKNKDIPKLVER